jgi:hypothetical protein
MIDLRGKQPRNTFDSMRVIWNPFQMKSTKVNCNVKNIPNKGFEHDEEL